MATRKRILTILPVVQVIIAMGLFASYLHRPEPRGDTLPAGGDTGLDIQYCWAVNAPAAIVAQIQRRLTNGFLRNQYPLDLIVDLTVFLSLVWLLWYAVAVEIGGKGLSILTRKTGHRRVADVLAMAFGASLVPYADRITLSVYHQTWVTPVHLVWIFAIIGFYGHDLWASFHEKPGEEVTSWSEPQK
jgi:hypothetical protein